ncbi:hypothetical protein ADL15_26855 [Actinoplanes awajinensis subsp. mycoplanecinus]|uniref:Uncharacterized protein n=1 Tax=Actinoplanes awajinensis subsp. mycoplanecinus TaxID=135947 RepID=A0A101JMP0_9ACTN|nr:hypothetical protein ADL15_26855 [Actinoplanes awajinensis subsp. mycoplanecinus]
MLVVSAGCGYASPRDKARDAAVAAARQRLDGFRAGFDVRLRQAADEKWAEQKLRDEFGPDPRDNGTDLSVIAVTVDGRRVTARFGVNGRGAGGGGGTYEEFSWVTCASIAGVAAPEPASQVDTIPCPEGFPPSDMWGAADAIGPLPAD